MKNLEKLRVKWYTSSGEEINFEEVKKMLRKIIIDENKIFIGTDSMIFSRKCTFVTAICVHDADRKLADYFYRRYEYERNSLKILQDRISQEVSDSIEIGFDLMNTFSKNDVEIHADIGTSRRSRTRVFADFFKKWISSAGFDFKFKPHSWASSSVADWYTKKEKEKKD